MQYIHANILTSRLGAEVGPIIARLCTQTHTHKHTHTHTHTHKHTLKYTHTWRLGAEAKEGTLLRCVAL